MTSTKRVVVLTGAGISAESGRKTCRGPDGLWEGNRVEDVASPEAWAANPGLVLEFYNQRRPHRGWRSRTRGRLCCG
jgi:NAD-dependent deacetylase